MFPNLSKSKRGSYLSQNNSPQEFGENTAALSKRGPDAKATFLEPAQSPLGATDSAYKFATTTTDTEILVAQTAHAHASSSGSSRSSSFFSSCQGHINRRSGCSTFRPRTPNRRPPSISTMLLFWGLKYIHVYIYIYIY